MPITVGPPQRPGGGAVLASDGALSSNIVTVGETIDAGSQDGLMPGKGTMRADDGALVPTLCGVLERVNKLVTVRPLRSRYTAQSGDVVVGRVVEVSGKRWKVDIRSTQEAVLQLSSVHIPGDAQRRHTIEDELAMRTILREGDLVSAEVQSAFRDGTIALQTRSKKFGLLVGGQLVHIPPALAKPQKTHITSIGAPASVDVVQGLNGTIFVAPHRPQDDDDEEEDMAFRRPAPAATAEEHERVARTCAAVAALALAGVMVHPAPILAAYSASVDQGVAVPDMTQPPFVHMVALMARDA
ncbi:unnamed protein product [Pedinophyceae sp. YPF-701]|nr:unnamed protein product [Pedinophyceae sp. YPF-701]